MEEYDKNTSRGVEICESLVNPQKRMLTFIYSGLAEKGKSPKDMTVLKINILNCMVIMNIQ